MRIAILLLLSFFFGISCREKDKNLKEIVPPTAQETTEFVTVSHNLAFGNRKKDDYQLKGFQEVLFSVADLDKAVTIYEDVAGWEVAYKGEVSAEQLAAWQVTDSAAAKEVVLHNPGDSTGFLRLVKFENVNQRQIRSSAQSWDTGGIFDVNVRVKDMAESFGALQANGWNAYHDPVEFKFGKFHVSEVLTRGPDGVVLAMIQRMAPPLEGYPNLRKLSHIFNGTQIVKDIEQSLKFYRDGLGFKMYLEHRGASSQEGENVLSIPYNMTDDYERSVYILHPQGVNLGSIELLQYHGIQGRDHSKYAVPPNLGILMHRFPVSNIKVFSEKIQKRGIAIKQHITTLALAPYGKVKSLAIQAPDGAWLEFIELVD